MTESPEITYEMLTAAVQDGANEYIGVRKQFSSNEIAAGADKDPRTIDGYRAGRAVPDLYGFLKLAALLPDGFINRVLALAGFHAQRIRPDAVTYSNLNAQAAAAMAVLSRALVDHRVDHTEEPGVLNELRQLHEKIGDILTERDQRKSEMVRH